MAVGPIPWTAIDAYASRFGIDRIEEFEFFAMLIRAIEAIEQEARGKS